MTLYAAVLALAGLCAPPAWGQPRPVPGGPMSGGAPAGATSSGAAPAGATPSGDATATPELKGRTVEDVRIVGNTTVPTATIRTLIRTRLGEKYDPQTVEEDYQRIYRELRKFSNVTARAEPTASGGVAVVFEVEEQKQVRSISFRGNSRIDAVSLRSAIDLHPGEAIDTFRLRLAEGAIQNLYRGKSFPFARVRVLPEPLAERGDVVFDIVEGPKVTVRKVEFIGNATIPRFKLGPQVKTGPPFLFWGGRYDPEQVDQDVAALRRYYEGRGYFDARIGRRLVWSQDHSDLQVDFLIDEGRRYVVRKVLFENNTSLSDAVLRKNLKLTEGRPFDRDVLEADRRRILETYSPLGFIYEPGGYSPAAGSNPDYLYIEPRTLVGQEPGPVDLVYSIHEGRPFRIGRIIAKGNSKTKDNVIIREMRFGPGQLFNSAGMRNAAERLRARPYFDYVNVTAIGDDPVYRDILVEVNERRTAELVLNAGVNSNGGIAGGVTYLQHNFDIANFPSDWKDILSDRAFTGAGQTFRLSVEPGTIATNASIAFTEPFLFDQNYSFTSEGYLRDRKREDYDDRRTGGRVTFGKRFDYVHSAAVTFRGEDVLIDNIDDPPLRAPEFIDAEGHSTITSVALEVRRDTRNPGLFPYRGSYATGRFEVYGALGGDYSFQKFELNWDSYRTLHEDLTERRTVLGLHANAGYINGDSVFFERFYGGGIGSVRGFRFRGISPREGLAEDPVGGNFAMSGSAELNFPLVGELIRGVTFTDVGTVERDLEIGTIRSSVGVGVRVILPLGGNRLPLAIDFGFPLSKDSQDDTQVISFSFGGQF